MISRLVAAFVLVGMASWTIMGRAAPAGAQAAATFTVNSTADAVDVPEPGTAAAGIMPHHDLWGVH